MQEQAHKAQVHAHKAQVQVKAHVTRSVCRCSQPADSSLSRLTSKKQLQVRICDSAPVRVLS